MERQVKSGVGSHNNQKDKEEINNNIHKSFQNLASTSWSCWVTSKQFHWYLQLFKS